MNVKTFKCICGNCKTKITDSIHVTSVSGDGSVTVWIICKCSRKWKGTFHLPEDFEVIEKGLKNDKN